MAPAILGKMDFRAAKGGWGWPQPDKSEFQITKAGCVVTAKGNRAATIDGVGVHTRNGDSIELTFEVLQAGRGWLSLDFHGGLMEFASVRIGLAAGSVTIFTSEWDRRQPVSAARAQPIRPGLHTLRLDKTEGAGRLVKMANLRVILDDEEVLWSKGINVLPETGVRVAVNGASVLLRRFVHRGRPTGVPEHLRLGGWQMLNVPDIDANLASIQRGLEAAAETGVRLLVTPETSLTGLYPQNKVTLRPGPIAAAERKLRRMVRQTRNAPYLVVGLPVWQQAPSRRQARTRYNVSRVYDPDGQVVLDAAKIHSCERGFWHGYRLNEFDVDGAPVCLHVCHDGRYPEVWTLPVMFGARLILHPANSGIVPCSVEAREAHAGGASVTSHAFYIHVNGDGGSTISSPAKYNNILAVSDECRRDNPAFPMCGKPVECLLHANIRLHDAFGYWPIRSYRVSEQAAEAYLQLYQTLGGARLP